MKNNQSNHESKKPEELAKRVVRHFDPWREEPLVCACGWKGNGGELVQGELFRELYEMDCPVCGEPRLIVSLPTIEEAAAHKDQMSGPERELFEKSEAFHERQERGRLVSPDQLPDIEGTDSFVLHWDMNWNVPDAFSRTNQIRHGQRVIWEELALYESYPRFAEVARILKSKYGDRLRDLVPTESSETYLWGDRLYAPSFTDEIRQSLRTGEAPA